jgi:GNAT superfamily N-acetyltransferase
MCGAVRDYGAAMRFPLSSELLQRLPRHPDWRYERIDGEAVLSLRPRPLHLRRLTALPVPEMSAAAEARELDMPSDRAAVAALLLDTWPDEDPYRSLEAPAELLSSEIERDLQTADFGAVAVAGDAGAVCAVVLVYSGRSGAPVLGWLTVDRNHRERGLATGLLGVITTVLNARGVRELASATSAANTASLRWHLSRGFQLAEDPLREALRGAQRNRSGAGARHARLTPALRPGRSIAHLNAHIVLS